MRFLAYFMAPGKRNILMTCWLCGAFLLLSPSIGTCRAATLQGIDVVAAGESTEVILGVDENVQYQQNYLPANDSLPARCYLDLYSTSRDPSLAERWPVDGRHISILRIGDYATKLRVVVDLKQESTCAVVSSGAIPFQLRLAVADPASLPTESNEADLPGAALSAENKLQMNSAAAEPPRETGTVSAVTDITGEAESPLAEFSSAGRDAAVSTWGWIRLYSAYDTRQDHAEDDHLARLRGRLGVDWSKTLDDQALLDLHAGVELDRFFYDSDLADEDTEVRLHETYLQYSRPAWDIAFGKQRVRWGKSDQLSPVDRLNPQDFRQFITIDLEERALPSWLLRNRWHGESVSLETIVQPWFQESELEYFDSDWALYRNLRQIITASPLASEALREYARNLHVDEDKPANTPENMSAAARFHWRTRQADFAVSYHYGWETLPTITNFPVKNVNYSGSLDADPAQLLADAVFTDGQAQAEYKRQQTVGFEWEAVLDPFGLRGEIAHIDRVAFLSSDLTSERKPVTHLVSGLDYTSATEWYFNLQGSWHHIHDYSEEILYFDDHTVSILGEISKPVWRGNLELALQYNYTITDQSSYLQPSVTLKYFRYLECEIGANLFSGDSDSLFGSYDSNDQIYAWLKASF